MTRRGTSLVLLTGVAAGALVLTGCSGDDPKAGPGSTSATSTPSASDKPAPLGTAYPVAPSATPSAEPALATKKARDGWVLTLTGVRRVADDRIVVEGSLDGSQATSNFSVWTEPGFKTLKDAGGATSGGLNGEFSTVALSVPGDPTTYLPVRDKDHLCLCTRLGPVTVKGSAPVYVVMSAPKGAAEVTVTVNGAGTFPHLKVSS